MVPNYSRTQIVGLTRSNAKLTCHPPLSCDGAAEGDVLLEEVNMEKTMLRVQSSFDVNNRPTLLLCLQTGDAG